MVRKTRFRWLASVVSHPSSKKRSMDGAPERFVLKRIHWAFREWARRSASDEAQTSG
jgi:hypothetical protein